MLNGNSFFTNRFKGTRCVKSLNTELNGIAFGNQKVIAERIKERVIKLTDSYFIKIQSAIDRIEDL